MRVQGNDDVVAVIDVSTHPLDAVGINIGRRHFDGRWQVDNDVALCGWLEDLEYLVAHVDGEFKFGARVGLRAVFVVNVCAGEFTFERFTETSGVDCDVDDALLIRLEHHVALKNTRRVVKVNDRILRTLD